MTADADGRRRFPAWAGSLAANLALALLSILFGLAAIEGAARMVVRRWSKQPQTPHGSVARFHPLLGWDKPPGTAVWLRRPEYEAFLKINPHGLRGPERDYEKPAGGRRVLILGDSFAEAYAVAEERSARALLESQLDARGCGRFEVLNGGTAAYSTDQEYLFYQIEGRKYRPDVVLLFFFFNDLAGNLSPQEAGRDKPYFELNGDRLVLRNSPLRPHPEAARMPEFVARPFRLKPWRGSMALRLLSDRTGEGNPALHRLLARLGLVEPKPFEPIAPDFWPFGPTRPEVLEMWRLEEAILKALKASVETNGGRLVVLYVPSRFEVNDRTWALTRDRYHMGRHWDRNRVFDKLQSVCAKLGTPLVDPRPALRKAESSSGAYFPRDGHWTEAGNAAAAAELAQTLATVMPCPGRATESAR